MVLGTPEKVESCEGTMSVELRTRPGGRGVGVLEGRRVGMAGEEVGMGRGTGSPSKGETVGRRVREGNVEGMAALWVGLSVAEGMRLGLGLSVGRGGVWLGARVRVGVDGVCECDGVWTGKRVGVDCLEGEGVII